MTGQGPGFGHYYGRVALLQIPEKYLIITTYQLSRYPYHMVSSYMRCNCNLLARKIISCDDTSSKLSSWSLMFSHPGIPGVTTDTTPRIVKDRWYKDYDQYWLTYHLYQRSTGATSLHTTLDSSHSLVGYQGTHSHASQLWREAQSWNHGLRLERGVWRGRIGALWGYNK